MRSRRARGTTLIELLVVLAMIGVLFGVIGASLPRVDEEATVALALDATTTRSQSVRGGRRVEFHRRTFAGEWTVVAHPDGRVFIDSSGTRWTQLAGGGDAR